ncbi:lytic polysaccharide monooxygenase auxiliary activity family 9 protein [Actinocrispum wychmicini]|nr:lytic polysaccharide monooxygenase auxiliary activity family 9 protein [Actinocrispum wychmicini]
MLFSVFVADAHGYTTAPVSRQMYCADGTVTNCGEIQWEPQSVEGPKSFPKAGPRDGTICSGGLSRFSQLDDPRGGKWPTGAVTAGTATFTWRLTAMHATTSFRYFITKDGWTGTKPLTRADLEPQPFFTKNWNGRQPGSTVTDTVTVPSGKTGRHLILGVWDIADTGNAFYSCSDVRF